MDQKELEKGIHEREALDADSRKVVELLSALPRVEAPANFEFRVKGGIAAGEAPSASSPWRFAKFAAPLAVLLVAVFALFYATLPSNDNIAVNPQTETAPQPQTDRPPVTGPGIEQTQPPVSATPQRQPVLASDSAPRSVTPSVNGNRFVRAASRSGSVDLPVSAPRQILQPGSVDRSVEAANVIDPPGINTNLGRNPNSNSSANTNVSVREVLDMLGIKAEFSDGGWAVRSTVENSVGSRAGIKSKDVVEALNEQPVTESTTLKGGFEGKSVRVRRDGKPITISLRP